MKAIPFNQFITGLIIGFMLLFTCLSMSQLIFHGALAAYSSLGMGLILLSTIVGLLG